MWIYTNSDKSQEYSDLPLLGIYKEESVINLIPKINSMQIATPNTNI